MLHCKTLRISVQLTTWFDGSVYYYHFWRNQRNWREKIHSIKRGCVEISLGGLKGVVVSFSFVDMYDVVMAVFFCNVVCIFITGTKNSICAHSSNLDVLRWEENSGKITEIIGFACHINGRQKEGMKLVSSSCFNLLLCIWVTALENSSYFVRISQVFEGKGVW